MACGCLFTTSLYCQLSTCYPQAYRKLFQQVVTSLQMTSYNKPDFNSLLQFGDKPVTFLAVYNRIEQVSLPILFMFVNAVKYVKYC